MRERMSGSGQAMDRRYTDTHPCTHHMTTPVATSTAYKCGHQVVSDGMMDFATNINVTFVKGKKATNEERP